VPAINALIVEDVSTQTWVSGKNSFEHLSDRRACDIDRRRRKMPLKVGSKCDSPHGFGSDTRRESRLRVHVETGANRSPWP
jgi:hypothetical protein